MSRAMRYHIVNKIAHGGMAEIFLALQLGAEGFQKQVVLKRILPALAADPSFVRMLVDEAHIASTLNHSNLVQVLDLGKSGDQFFLVLEFVDGWSLEQVRRRAQKARQKLPLPLTLYVVGALCRALAYVHTRKRAGRPLGIVHRDVTPQNVLLSREGEVKLADFGIAKAIGKTEKSATGVIKGKFAYMSPEQSVGGDLDARSDLFSVGTLLYLLATGRKPFEGATDLDVLMQVRKARYEKPSALVRDFNPEVERFIARALRADRSRRWQSAEQMADRIDAILIKLGQAAGPATLKRWLDALRAKDGARAPAELAELPSTSDVIELGSRDLELEQVPPTDGGPPAKGDAAGSQATTAPAIQRRPPPAIPDTPTEPGPAALSVGGGAYAAYGVESVEDGDNGNNEEDGGGDGSEHDDRNEHADEPADQLCEEEPRTPDVGPSSEATLDRFAGLRPIEPPLKRAPVRPVSATGGIGFEGAFTRTRSGAATPEQVAPDVSIEDGPDRRARPDRRRWLRRAAFVTVVAALAGGGATYVVRQHRPAWLVDPLTSLWHRLPRPTGGPDWTGDPRLPEPTAR